MEGQECGDPIDIPRRGRRLGADEQRKCLRGEGAERGGWADVLSSEFVFLLLHGSWIYNKEVPPKITSCESDTSCSIICLYGWCCCNWPWSYLEEQLPLEQLLELLVSSGLGVRELELGFGMPAWVNAFVLLLPTIRRMDLLIIYSIYSLLTALPLYFYSFI